MPSAPLRVAHVVDEGAWGGLATFVSNLISSQLADPEIGNIHLICDPGSLDPVLSNLPVTVHAYRSDRRAVAVAKTVRAIATHLRALKPDIVVLHSTFPGFWGRLIQSPTWKILYCAHGWAFQQRVSFVKKQLYRAIEWWLSARSDAVVSISRSEYAAGERAGIRPRIHRLIRHGLPASVSAPTLRPTDRPGLTELLFVGRFDRQKGLDILLQAFDDPRLEGVTLSLVGQNVIGEGISVPQRANLRHLGWIANSQIDSAIREADAVIVPSRWEGFGLIALEAMRNKRAVLCSGVGGLNEIVRDGVNGRIFDINDIESIRNLLCDITVAELNRLGSEGYHLFCENYLWSNCYREWRGLVSEIAVIAK